MLPKSIDVQNHNHSVRFTVDLPTDWFDVDDIIVHVYFDIIVLNKPKLSYVGKTIKIVRNLTNIAFTTKCEIQPGIYELSDESNEDELVFDI